MHKGPSNRSHLVKADQDPGHGRHQGLWHVNRITRCPAVFAHLVGLDLAVVDLVVPWQHTT